MWLENGKNSNSLTLTYVTFRGTESSLSTEETDINYWIFYLRQGGYVLQGVCLSDCPLPTSRKSYRSDRNENFTRDVSVDKKELIKLWKSSTPGSGSRNFYLAHISGKTYRSLSSDSP